MVPSNIYDPSFKAARKKQWCLGVWAMGGGGSQTFLSYILGGREIFFQRELCVRVEGAGVVKCQPHENVTDLST